MHRRSADDEEWQKTKKIVRERDKYSCRLCGCLTPGEYKLSSSNCANKQLLQASDCAHAEAVGTHPDKVYDADQIFFLCRFHHRSMDSGTNPVTLEHMDYNEQWYWWYRIKNRTAEKYDETIDYNELFLENKVLEKPKEEEKPKKSLSDIIAYL